MPQNYYSDDPEPAEGTPAEEAGESAEYESEEQGGEKKTAVIDSSICPGMKPGDDMILKIEAVRDGEYTVSYSPEPETPEEKADSARAEEESEGGGGGNPGSMASMMY